MDHFDQLLAIIRRKAVFDRHNPWYAGPESYLDGLHGEVAEVVEEIAQARTCYLEDELGDLLWNCLNAIVALEKTTDVRLDAVLQRACRKFETRVSGLEAGLSWEEIKAAQKQALADEYAAGKNRQAGAPS